MNVLHVAQPVDGGVAVYLGWLAGDQVARGWSVIVACPSGGFLATSAVDAGARHETWEARRSPAAGVWMEYRRLRHIVRAVRPDIVHLHSSKAGLIGRLRDLGAPRIFQPHGWSWKAVSGIAATAAVAWERSSAGRAAAIVCVSEAERIEAERRGLRAKWAVIPNGVDLDRWRPASPEDRERARVRLGLPDAPLAVCVGTVRHAKGQDLLVRAWPRVVARLPQAQLAIIGDGPDRARLAREVSGNVTLVGHRDDVPEWLAASDVVVVPSRWEGLSLAMLEGMARSRSVVGTDVSGARECIADDAGAVVPAGDSDALIEALVQRLSDPIQADSEGRAGRARVERDHDLRVTGERIADLYQRLSD